MKFRHNAQIKTADANTPSSNTSNSTMKLRIPADICVCCGRPVPEGTMVCTICERSSV